MRGNYLLVDLLSQTTASCITLSDINVSGINLILHSEVLEENYLKFETIKNTEEGLQIPNTG